MLSVCVFQGGDQLPSSDVLYLLPRFDARPNLSQQGQILLVGYRSIRAALPTPSRNRIGDASCISSHPVDLLR
jgi:hypothetical protein